MTLTTRIAIETPTPVRPVFDECRRIIGGQDAPFDHTQNLDIWEDGRWSYANEMGIGLPAWLDVRYGLDAPIKPYEDEEDHPFQDGFSVDVVWDTTYGYRASNGAGCEDLHAWLIAQLGAWLDERGLKWAWNDEFNGVWHVGCDGLDEFGDITLGALS